MNKIKKITFLLVIFVLCIFQVVYGFSVTDLTGTPVSNSDATNLGDKIVLALGVAGSVLSVIVLVVIGIKYMLGSVEEKAEYKKTLMPYVIGAVLVFAASTISGVINELAKSIM